MLVEAARFLRVGGIMSERRTHATAGSPEFSELWRNVSNISYNKTQSRKTGQRMPDTTTSPMCNDARSPRHRGGRYPGFNHGDSPGDGEASQDIFWDSTSPTQAGLGHWNTRVVEISDIVNRIAPKNMKSKGKECSLLQWINDSAIPCTPEIPKPRVKKRSSRQSSVDDLMKLAKQFDENMQQDQESSERLNAVNNNLNERVYTSEAKLTDSSVPSHVKDLKCPSSSDQVEAELHALFDCSTQRVSGNLSEASACSQEIKDLAVTSALAERQQSEFKSADKCESAAHPSEQKGTRIYNTNSCDDFDDDWENDDLLNDPFVLAITQNPNEQLDAKPKTTFQPDTKTNATQFTSVCKPTTNKASAHQPSGSHCKMSCRALQELCPKPKATNRSTFKLEPNPHFQPKMAKDVSKFSYTKIEPKSNMTHQKSATTKTDSTLKPDKANNDHIGYLKEPSVKDISDSLWDDWGDDALLYQVCDSMEKISNSQPQQVNPSNCQEKQNIAMDRQKRTSDPLQIDMAQSMKAHTNRESACAFVRSKSLPETSCEAVNYQGWNIPMKSANNKSGMSQSFPGSHTSLGTFSHCRDSSGTFQSGNTNVDMKLLMARAPQNSKSHHPAFKRNVSDSAIISNKVFVTSQMTGKCSAADIERKKQEALARRRLRLQNASKPP
ncbi:ewing's tumor-associated antigen 1 homolog isoform X2 [Melanotaenia boesemani]|uniref:ewing's tumor-associated antigen 1 homolog isoform X2 n=1 Tax=Melanotaenia boesemani TaxID=1250792 RepID=UPI001C04DA33|nr:ewing's tumor-associated antigen 1 homolog isoform X2 [Melanotaenia boesemani]